MCQVFGVYGAVGLWPNVQRASPVNLSLHAQCSVKEACDWCRRWVINDFLMQENLAWVWYPGAVAGLLAQRPASRAGQPRKLFKYSEGSKRYYINTYCRA